MIVLAGFLGFVALNVAVIVAQGAIKARSLRTWWRS